MNYTKNIFITYYTLPVRESIRIPQWVFLSCYPHSRAVHSWLLIAHWSEIYNYSDVCTTDACETLKAINKQNICFLQTRWILDLISHSDLYLNTHYST